MMSVLNRKKSQNPPSVDEVISETAKSEAKIAEIKRQIDEVDAAIKAAESAVGEAWPDAQKMAATKAIAKSLTDRRESLLSALETTEQQLPAAHRADLEKRQHEIDLEIQAVSASARAHREHRDDLKKQLADAERALFIAEDRLSVLNRQKQEIRRELHPR